MFSNIIFQLFNVFKLRCMILTAYHRHYEEMFLDPTALVTFGNLGSTLIVDSILVLLSLHVSVFGIALCLTRFFQFCMFRYPELHVLSILYTSVDFLCAIFWN